jgi:hypothetical protein
MRKDLSRGLSCWEGCRGVKVPAARLEGAMSLGIYYLSEMRRALFDTIAYFLRREGAANATPRLRGSYFALVVPLPGYSTHRTIDVTRVPQSSFASNRRKVGLSGAFEALVLVPQTTAYSNRPP